MRLALKPLTQGDVSGDCVFYSALNAVRLLWPERLGDIEVCETLFGELVRRWSKQHGAVDTLLIVGAETEFGWQVAQLMQGVLAEKGLRLECRAIPKSVIDEKPDATRFFAWLHEEFANSPTHCACAVIGLDDPWNHWTVIRGFGLASMRIFFFDSWAIHRLTWKLASSFSTVPGSSERGKIEIDVPATVIYRRIDEDISA
jgi:hypothetical protein